MLLRHKILSQTTIFVQMDLTVQVYAYARSSPRMSMLHSSRMTSQHGARTKTWTVQTRGPDSTRTHIPMERAEKDGAEYQEE